MASNKPPVSANTPLSFQKAKVYLSWQDIQNLCNNLIKNVRRPNNIVAVARGGLIPGTILSHAFNVPLHTLQARSYETKGVTKLEEINVQIPQGTLGVMWNQHTLVIDDIIDTGRTFDVLKSYADQCQYAALVTKKSTTDIYATRYASDQWVIFPWEGM